MLTPAEVVTMRAGIMRRRSAEWEHTCYLAATIINHAGMSAPRRPADPAKMHRRIVPPSEGAAEAERRDTRAWLDEMTRLRHERLSRRTYPDA